MRSAGAILGVLILAAGVAAAADDQTARPAGTIVSGGTQNQAGQTTPATQDVDRFIALHVRIQKLENKLDQRPPVAEDKMWTALWIVGVALTAAWVWGKVLERKDAERGTKLAIWKELAQALKTPVDAPHDPKAALEKFVSRLEVVSREMRELTGRAERVIRDIDASLDTLSKEMPAVEKGGKTA